MHELFPNVFLMMGFVFIHLFSKRLSFKRFSLRTFLSFSGGVGLTYVFLHLLPKRYRNLRKYSQRAYIGHPQLFL